MNTSLRILMLTVLGLACLGLSACNFPPRFYRMDVQQGSDVTPEMVSKLKKGMSKDQVQNILGTPTLTHVLDTERWDYYYSLVPGTGGPKIERHFSVFFNGNRVAYWEGTANQK